MHGMAVIVGDLRLASVFARTPREHLHEQHANFDPRGLQRRVPGSIQVGGVADDRTRNRRVRGRSGKWQPTGEWHAPRLRWRSYPENSEVVRKNRTPSPHSKLVQCACPAYDSTMTIADDIEDRVRRKPGLTEAELAAFLFGRDGYQQQVNSACRRLVRDGRIVRHGRGGPGDPFTYHLPPIKRRA
jgi:hypothetical protein